MNYFQNKNSSGFTLIELLVVIAIIGVLSGVVLQSLKGARQKSQNATRLSDIDQINKSLELYFTKQNTGVGTFPSSAGAWQCIGLTPATTPCWGGTTFYGTATTIGTIYYALTGNISKIPKDPQFVGAVGDYYLYNSSLLVTDPLAYNGAGAYLRWIVNDFGSKSCGRGKIDTTYVSTGFKQCLLYLGK